MINEMIGHFECNSIEEKNKNKYLVLDDLDENKEVLKKYEEVWVGIKKGIETINGGKKIEYGKNLKKIRFVMKCHDLLTMADSLRNVAILSAKGATFRCILMGISKNEGLKRLNNSVAYDRGVLQIWILAQIKHQLK